MKKIITLLAVFGIVSFQSCTVNDNAPIEDNDTIPQAFEIKNKNFNYNANDGFYIYDTFNNKLGGDLYNDETILVYRLTGSLNSSTPIWQLIPRTIYLSGGREIDYDYDFSKKDFTIYASGNYDLELTPEFLDNQTFRIVILPSSLLSSVDKNNFSEVMSVLKINESQIQKVDL
ncbi:hypothetical protein [Flavobacterium sp.]|uniref:hypothetical protein n=1 Tax=Flavobacterium sp. TaxID=239 RepID=UPI002869FDB8|nr:hypothetical protein [Flavobacterium sp.]